MASTRKPVARQRVLHMQTAMTPSRQAWPPTVSPICVNRLAHMQTSMPFQYRHGLRGQAHIGSVLMQTVMAMPPERRQVWPHPSKLVADEGLAHRRRYANLKESMAVDRKPSACLWVRACVDSYAGECRQVWPLPASLLRANGLACIQTRIPVQYIVWQSSKARCASAGLCTDSHSRLNVNRHGNQPQPF